MIRAVHYWDETWVIDYRDQRLHATKSLDSRSCEKKFSNIPSLPKSPYTIRVRLNKIFSATYLQSHVAPDFLRVCFQGDLRWSEKWWKLVVECGAVRREKSGSMYINNEYVYNKYVGVYMHVSVYIYVCVYVHKGFGYKKY